MHSLGKVWETHDFPKVDFIEFSWMDIVHLYGPAPIMGEIKEAFSDNKFKVK